MACRPEVLEIGEGTATVSGPALGSRRLVRHEQIENWVLMATIDHGGERLAVFEDFGEHGEILFAGASGMRLVLGKTREATRVEESASSTNSGKALLGTGYDVFRERLLAGDDDPDPATIAAAIPPIRRARSGPFELPHTFLGSPDCIDTVPLHYDPRRAHPRVNPLAVAPEIAPVIDEERIEEGLVGSWLPCVLVAYPVSEQVRWEAVAFAVPEPPTPYLQPVWYRYLRLDGASVSEAHYFDTYLPYPITVEPPAERFYEALLDLHEFWSELLAGGMSVELPDAWIADFCRHSLVLETISRVGAHPRYGVVERAYGGPEHDGLQDVMTSSVTCYSEWGLFERARRYLDDYLTNFVRADGSIDYRGPEIGQYGRMLTVLARFASLTSDASVLLEHREKISAIAEILLTRREAAKQRRRDDPAYGLLAGRHEADISFDVPDLATACYEQPYFSNSTEAWRGLRDLGRGLVALAGSPGCSELASWGEALVAEAADLASDIARAIGSSWRSRRGVELLPLIAGSEELHLDAPARSRPSSFDENRVFSEMLYSGLLDASTVSRIVTGAARSGESGFGIFGNRKLLVAFTACGTAYGLLQHDLVREFLLLYYAHAYHLHTRGTWTAFECVDLDRDRAEHLPFCAPAQLTVPILTKWMLAFEDPLSDVLWLAKAAPRRWLSDGGRIAVKSAPLSGGAVSYEVTSLLEAGKVEATVELPSGRTEPVLLRLRVPGRRRLRGVELDGSPWTDFDADQEAIAIPPAGRSELVARY